MYNLDKAKEELQKELKQLQEENSLLWASHDIDNTKPKVAEEQLRESDDRYKDLIENSSDFICIHDLDGNILDVNSATAKETGYTDEELSSMKIQDLMPPEHQRLFSIYIDKLKAKGKAKGIFTVHYKNGEKHLWEFYDTLRTAGVTKPIVRGMAKDIKERKRNEEILLLYREMIKNMSEGVYVVGLNDGIIKYANPKFKQIFGYEAGEMIGKHVSIVNAPTDEAPEIRAEAIMKVIRETGEWHGEVQNIKKDGATFWCSANVSVFDHPIYGKVIMAVHADITERKLAEQIIKLKNEQLIKLNAEKDRFFSIIAHDLRSPFNTLLGFIHLMVEELPSLTPEEIQKIALSMRNSANKLYSLLGNLLEWSQMQQGMLSYQPNAFNFLNGILPIMDSVRDTAKNKMIAIGYDFPEDLRVVADKNMFASLMSNLLFNAIKFTPKEGRVYIVAKPIAGNSVEVSISDTGIGMNKNLLDKLFNLGENAIRPGTEGEPSSGLGLLICKDFVEKHGGKIWVESEEGKGSTFYFTIPRDAGPGN